MNSSLREVLGRLGPIRPADRVSSGSPGRLAIAIPSDGQGRLRSIDAILALAARHVPLVQAKHAVEALMAGLPCPPLDLAMVEDADALSAELTKAGIAATWLERPSSARALASAEREAG